MLEGRAFVPQGDECIQVRSTNVTIHNLAGQAEEEGQPALSRRVPCSLSHPSVRTGTNAAYQVP
jgi:hypothetical protein